MAGQSTQATLKKATLYQITLQAAGEPQKTPNGKSVDVQFNPQTLKLAYNNENKSANQPVGSASQFVGSGTSKLTVELLFDTSQTGKDVRASTTNIAYFITASIGKPAGQNKQQKRVPPGCRFEWGTFRFDGVVDSLQETLDYFSEDGVPLRSTVAIGLSGVDSVLPAAPATGAPGASPTVTAPANSSMPQVAGANGDSSDWKSQAAANNIDDPLHLPAGTSLDLGAAAGAAAAVGGALSAGGGAAVGFSAGLGGGAGFAAGASAGFGASAGIGLSASAGAGISAGAGLSLGSGLSAGAGVSTSGGAGVTSGVGASAGIAVSAGAGASASAGLGARSNAAGSFGGSFGVGAGASASAGFGAQAG